MVLFNFVVKSSANYTKSFCDLNIEYHMGISIIKKPITKTLIKATKYVTQVCFQNPLTKNPLDSKEV